LSKGLNHRHFQNLLSKLGAECDDLVYCYEVWQVSCGRMLKHMFSLRKGSQDFMESKGKSVHEFQDTQWVYHFVHLVNITGHLNEPVIFKTNSDAPFTNSIKGFQTKLVLWECQLKASN
jgi:hypothetical protein